ncbi:N-acetyl-gamma-glutamyl-phosphate reductase [Alphaproteobacteria bacterium]|nr:N-acetyl-gamma-glutamyl-phosphate reductase [Alphaproteobacteria bacterium]
MIKVGIIGANGFLGLELLRILSIHPKVEISKILKRENDIEDEFTHLSSLDLNEVQTSNIADFKSLDCVFLSLPHGSASEYVKELIDKVKIIDLSSDYRIDDAKSYETYYKTSFDPDIQSKFTYGFIESSLDKIKKSSNVANPGCFALASQLAILPFHSLIKNISITAITGSSGGGKLPSIKNHHSTRSKDIFSYNINKHRHLAEIFQSYPSLNNKLSFVPLSGPFTRGIYLTAHIQTSDQIDLDSINSLIAKTFINMPFVRIQQQAKLSNVVGSNYCDLSVSIRDENNFVVESCIDNLIKGASGNAVECMNLMFAEDQSLGLKEMLPLYL